jgi:hypothetical protein
MIFSPGLAGDGSVAAPAANPPATATPHPISHVVALLFIAKSPTQDQA